MSGRGLGRVPYVFDSRFYEDSAVQNSGSRVFRAWGSEGVRFEDSGLGLKPRARNGLELIIV